MIGTRFNSVMAARFKGCALIGEMHNPNTGHDLKVYKLPDDLNKDFHGEPNLVGVDNGISCYIAHRLFSLRDFKEGSFSPKERRVVLNAGQARPRVKVKIAGHEETKPRVKINQGRVRLK